MKNISMYVCISDKHSAFIYLFFFFFSQSLTFYIEHYIIHKDLYIRIYCQLYGIMGITEPSTNPTNQQILTIKSYWK